MAQPGWLGTLQLGRMGIQPMTSGRIFRSLNYIPLPICHSLVCSNKQINIYLNLIKSIREYIELGGV
jgi:hypothetical protein